MGEEVARYLDFALSAPGVVQRHRFTRELFALSCKVTSRVFRKTIQRAHRYRIVDLATVRRIAWLRISQGEDALPEVVVDQDFQQRPAYQEGCLTDLPDLSVYDQLPDEDNEDDDEWELSEEDQEWVEEFWDGWNDAHTKHFKKMIEIMKSLQEEN